LIANIAGMDQAIDKWKMALGTKICSTFDENNLAKNSFNRLICKN